MSKLNYQAPSTSRSPLHVQHDPVTHRGLSFNEICMNVPGGPRPAPRDPKHRCQCVPHFTPGWVLGPQPVWCWGWCPQHGKMVLGLPREPERMKAWGDEGEGLSATGLCRSRTLMQLPPPWHLRGVPWCPPHGRHPPPATACCPCCPRRPRRPCA